MTHSSFTNGCKRAVWIAEKNVSFRSIVTSKAPQGLLALERTTDRSTQSSIFNRVILDYTSRITIYATERSDICFFGKTVNNRKEFAFLKAILSENGVDFSDVNFIDSFQHARVHAKSHFGLISRIRAEAASFAEQCDFQVAQCWQLIQYASSYASFCASYSDRPDSCPKIGVVANDHSPAQVAYKAVMDELKVPVVYLQHAEISPAFPPLDFHVSVLRNAKSLETYQAIGPVKGSTAVLSRTLSNSRFPEVVAAQTFTNDRPVVGIYPTSQFDAARVEGIAKKISQNPFVEKVVIKLHPNSGTKLISPKDARYEVTTDIPEQPHVAVVGNSSVAAELLGMGVPVFQLFALDDIENDYYGFVAGGLTKSVTIEECERSRFWCAEFYNDDWLRRSARFDPSAAAGQEDARRDLAMLIARELVLDPVAPIDEGVKGVRQAVTFRNRINRSLAAGIQRLLDILAKHFPREFNRLAVIVSSSVPLSARSFNLQVGDISRPPSRDVAWLMNGSKNPYNLADAILNTSDASVKLALISWFNSNWASRSPLSFDLIRGAVDRQSDNTDPWLQMITHEIAAIPISPEDAQLLIAKLSSVHDLKLRRTYEQTAMRVLLKNKHISAALALIERSPVHQVSTLSGNMKVEIAKHLLPANAPFDDRQKDQFVAGLSHFDRLKISASGGPAMVSSSDHKSLEVMFAALARPSLSAKFRELVLPAYDAMRERMIYMDARTNLQVRNDLIEAIATAITGRKPFSLLRLGDGEAYLFDDEGLPFTEADRRMRERHWWNCELDAETRTDICVRGKYALRQADVVGVPSIHRFVRDYSESSSDLLGSTANRGIVSSLVGFQNLGLNHSLVTEDRIHHLVFTPELLAPYLSTADRTIVISSIKRSVVEEAIGRACNRLDVIEIPTHAKTVSNPVFTEAIEALPVVISRIAEQLRSVGVGPGDLVLVSAGVAGKGLIGLAKDNGAVALDLGGQVEALVGVPNGALF
ncbi:hypothetical protein [Aliihoeflea sp. 2WW]|uniref:GT-D fold domain-containing protein n=1 Tax=Aliihoeflea sp. 2WW TaxID=1381123 RepID=UPI0004B37994|nr:hypothetical protein [Aliihoeflea sp. 2WW]